MAQLIAWFEIPAGNFDNMVSFYSTVFNVEVEIRNFNNTLHGVFNTGEGYVSGAIVKSDETSSAGGPVLFFRVPDIGLALEKVESLGGRVIHPKTLIRNEAADGRKIIPKTMIDGSSGYFALFSDPEGHKMGLYSNS